MREGKGKKEIRNERRETKKEIGNEKGRSGRGRSCSSHTSCVLSKPLFCCMSGFSADMGGIIISYNSQSLGMITSV